MKPGELVKVFYQLEPNEQYLIHTEPPTARPRRNLTRQRLAAHGACPRRRTVHASSLIRLLWKCVEMWKSGA